MKVRSFAQSNKIIWKRKTEDEQCWYIIQDNSVPMLLITTSAGFPRMINFSLMQWLFKCLLYLSNIASEILLGFKESETQQMLSVVTADWHVNGLYCQRQVGFNSRAINMLGLPQKKENCEGETLVSPQDKIVNVTLYLKLLLRDWL